MEGGGEQRQERKCRQTERERETERLAMNKNEGRGESNCTRANEGKEKRGQLRTWKWENWRGGETHGAILHHFSQPAQILLFRDEIYTIDA